MTEETQVNICNECGNPFRSPYGILSVCNDCTQNELAQMFQAEGDPAGQMFAARPEQNDPNWQQSIQQGEPMDMAWRLLKGLI